MKNITQETEGCQGINLHLESPTNSLSAKTLRNNQLSRNPFLHGRFPPGEISSLMLAIEDNHPKSSWPGMVEWSLDKDGGLALDPSCLRNLLDIYDDLYFSAIYVLWIPEGEGFFNSSTGYEIAIILKSRTGNIKPNLVKGIKSFLGEILRPFSNQALDDDYAASPAGQAKREPKSLTRTKSRAQGTGAGQAEKFPDQDGSQVPESEKTDPRLLPAPEKPKETRKKTPFPSEWKKQYATSIIQKFLGTWHFKGLPRGAIELFWILIYFSRGPRKGHLTRYVIMGVNQMSSLMEIRKSELLALMWGKERKEVEKMGTSTRSIRYNLALLLKRKLQIDVRRGEKDWQVSKRVLALSPGQAPHFNLLGKQAEERHKRREAKRIKTLKRYQAKSKPDISQLPEETKPPPGKISNT